MATFGKDFIHTLTPDVKNLSNNMDHEHFPSLLPRAQSLDPQDAQIASYLALQLALVRQVRAKKREPDHL